MVDSAALLLAALLFGGMSLFSFGFAPFLFRVLPQDTVRAVIRQAFPPFYLFVIAVSAAACIAFLPTDWRAAAVFAGISGTTVAARQILMPAINRASDEGRRRDFGMLHGASVVLTVTHILLTAFALVWWF